MATVERHRKHGCFLSRHAALRGSNQLCRLTWEKPLYYSYRDRVLLHTSLIWLKSSKMFSKFTMRRVRWLNYSYYFVGFCVLHGHAHLRSLYYEKSFFWVEWPWTTIKDYIHLTALQGLQASTGTCTKPRRGAEPHFSRIFKDQQDMVLLGHPTLELLVDTFTTFKPGWWTIQSG